MEAPPAVLNPALCCATRLPPQFLDLATSLIEGRVDASNYEDETRALLGEGGCCQLFSWQGLLLVVADALECSNYEDETCALLDEGPCCMYLCVCWARSPCRLLAGAYYAATQRSTLERCSMHSLMAHLAHAPPLPWQ